MSERSTSGPQGVPPHVSRRPDLDTSLLWHVQRVMLVAMVGFGAITLLYVVAPPAQPAVSIAWLSFAVCAASAVVAGVTRAVPPRRAIGLGYVAATIVAVHPLGVVALTGQPHQSVVIVFFMLAGAGVLPSWRVAGYLTLVLLVGWFLLRPPMTPAESSHWTVNVVVSACVAAVIAELRERFVRTIDVLASQDAESRRRLEEQAAVVMDARDAALESARAKGRFLANMSHEIRTPLNGIIGMLSLLRRTPLHAEQERYLDEVVRSSELLMAIVNDILDVSKIEAGAVELELVTFDLAELVEEVASAHAATAIHRGIELIADVDANLPRQVVGDPLRVRQIVTNLVSNAIKFTSKGEVVVSARLLETTPRGTVVVRVAVTDTGVGIPADKLATIFNPFSQADSSTTRQFGGTGLGLSICRQLVGLMGGELRVSSVEGQGSAFSFELELEKEDLLTTRGLKVNSRLWNAHVLIMDASERMRATLQSQLGAWGVTTELCSTPEEAVQAAQDLAEAGRPLDVAIVDVTSLGSPVTRNAQELGAHLAPLGCTMIAMGSALGELRQRLDVCGFVADLPKPIHRNRLLDVLNVALAATPIVPEVGALLTDPPPPGAAALTSSLPPANGLRVLVAEDNETNQRVAVAHLRALGYASDVVGDGAAALARLADADHGYACVLMDGQMPTMDGYEATRGLRELEQRAGRPRLPVIALSASVLSEDHARAQQAGMDAYLAKPFTFEQLDATLQACCARSPDGVPLPRMEASGGPVMLDLDGELDWREVLDVAIVDQLLMLEQGSPGFFAQVVETYLSTSDENLQELHAAVQAGQLEVAQRRAHALVGSSRQVGAARLGELCARIERATSLPALSAHLAELPDALQRAQRALVAVVQRR